MARTSEQLKQAIALALAGDWHGAHALVQLDEVDPLSCWLHACLHKIEGDIANARYWYRRSGGRTYDDFADAGDELDAIKCLAGPVVTRPSS